MCVVCCGVCVVSPGSMRCSDRSTRQLYTVQSQSGVQYMCTHNLGHNTVMSRNIGMSVNVAWFPDYGHIVAGIFMVHFGIVYSILINDLQSKHFAKSKFCKNV